MSKLKKIIASVLPGIFLIGYNVGTGSVTSMSKAGANFGLDLLWTIFISCIITYYLITHFSKYTMVSGETIIDGIKKHIHPAVALVLIAALSSIILSALMGLLGILVEVLEVASQTGSGKGIPQVYWAIFIAVGIYVLLWIGNYSFFEKVLAIFVAVMGACFIATMFVNFPSIGEITKGFVPQVPDTAEGSDNSPLIIVAGMVGTTVSVFAFIIRSQIVKETGWKMKDNTLQKRDAFVSASMMFVISAAVLITASSTLHVQGLKMNNVAEMIPLLEPIAGKAAMFVFVVGILAAGLSSHLPNLLVIPWLMIDFNNEERNTRTTKYRIVLLVLSIISVLGVVAGIKPVFILMLSQASIAIVLPLTIACIFFLTSKKAIMGKHTNRIHDVVILTLILVFALYMSNLGIQGLIADLKS
ncbi:divalent metal cation transporter [Maribellus luteus]|uniref:Divalent metal cation transporter n=1 Tax=Maribellus luteus TaxID=2305463 RepID=A0A399T911_9BACT|nr:Nramp family divalent metal transporter [Maribellus luteus]RIJ50413.1 divalent metal cation transporter [Maribellus luteus]